MRLTPPRLALSPHGDEADIAGAMDMGAPAKLRSNRCARVFASSIRPWDDTHSSPYFSPKQGRAPDARRIVEAMSRVVTSAFSSTTPLRCPSTFELGRVIGFGGRCRTAAARAKQRALLPPRDRQARCQRLM